MINLRELAASIKYQDQDLGMGEFEGIFKLTTLGLKVGTSNIPATDLDT